MNGDVLISPGTWLAPAVDWLNLNFRPFFAAISFVIESTLGGINWLLLSMPPLVLVALSVVFALVLANRRIAVLVAVAMGFCYVAGLWEATVQTVTLVTISVIISVAIAFPLGVIASRVKAVETALRPVLDIMQTVPPWVYLIPAVIVFSLGSVPAIIATVIYGVPPMLRLTTLAFKQVPKDLLELGQAIGATRQAILVKIELPAAMPTLLVGLNQCILLSLAMVVLAGLVGAGGLGAEVTRGLTRMEMGVGLRAGLAIVTVAIVLDRLSRGAIQRRRTANAG